MIGRRAIIAALGSTAALRPWATQAQQRAMPVIGFLGTSSPAPNTPFLAAMRKGLLEGGYEADKTVAIEYRWAEGRYERLPALAAELVTRNVDIIVAQGGSSPAVIAKKATQTIPIVFITGGDPVADGLVEGLARPSANLTGVTWISSNLGPKRLELLRELAPNATTFALMVNPDAVETERTVQELQDAARASGVGLTVFKARDDAEIAQTFASVAEARSGGLVVGVDAYFGGRRQLLASLAAKHGVAVMGGFREYAVDGCLMSYGPSLADAFRQGGLYAAKLLKGIKPGDLPVLQPTIFELVINLKAARALGITIAPKILALADEVIE